MKQTKKQISKEAGILYWQGVVFTSVCFALSTFLSLKFWFIVLGLFLGVTIGKIIQINYLWQKGYYN